MTKNIFIVIMLIINVALSEELNLNLSEFSKINDQVAKDIKPQITPNADPKKRSLVLSCKNRAGRVIKMNEPGYEECLSEIQMKANTSQSNPASTTINQTGSQDASFLINVGD